MTTVVRRAWEAYHKWPGIPCNSVIIILLSIWVVVLGAGFIQKVTVH